jgi:O-antigen ligase
VKDIALERPLLGYGFGTEEKVFVDRWYGFQGGTPENSIVGLLIQVGVVGLMLMLAIVSMVGVGAIRAVRSADVGEQSVGRVGLAVLVAALALTCFQAYVYSVGNVATLTVWVVLFLIAATTLGKGGLRKGDAS